MYEGSRYSCQILITVERSRLIFENTQILNCMKILSLGAELFHADRQTDMTKITVAIRSFANALDQKVLIPEDSTLVCLSTDISTLQKLEQRAYKSFTNFTYEWAV